MATLSPWGITRGVLSPDRSARNSAWGRATATLAESRDEGNSQWAVINGHMYNPHLPIGVLLPGNVMKYVPIHSLVGGQLK